MIDQIIARNLKKFRELNKFDMPVSQYAITASGPLGIRGIREIGDVDIIVTDELWDVLAAKFGVTDTGSIKKIVLPGSDIEVLGERSFYTTTEDKDAPAISERIAKAEIINDLPFEAIEHILYYKRKMGRDKDLRDIATIEEWQRNNN